MSHSLVTLCTPSVIPPSLAPVPQIARPLVKGDNKEVGTHAGHALATPALTANADSPTHALVERLVAERFVDILAGDDAQMQRFKASVDEVWHARYGGHTPWCKQTKNKEVLGVFNR